MKKVAIIHPQLVEGGGSGAIALYIAEALKDEYDITIISAYASSLDKLNEYYGTHLTYEDLNIIEHPLSFFFKKIKSFDVIRGGFFEKFCRILASSFDLLISTYNVMDFGEPGIHFIADFSFVDKLRRRFDISKGRVGGYFYRDTILRRIYLGFGRLISGPSRYEFRKSFTIAISEWTAQIMREEFDVYYEVLYPAVIGEFPKVSWEKKGNGFVYLGRLVPEKRIG